MINQLLFILILLSLLITYYLPSFLVSYLSSFFPSLSSFLPSLLPYFLLNVLFFFLITFLPHVLPSFLDILSVLLSVLSFFFLSLSSLSCPSLTFHFIPFITSTRIIGIKSVRIVWLHGNLKRKKKKAKQYIWINKQINK